MEPLATKILLTKLHKKKVGIRLLTTDRSSQFKQGHQHWPDEERVEADQTWIRHLAYGEIGDERPLHHLQAEEVLDARLLDQECAQHVLVLVLSIPQYVSGVHHFPENKLFKKCQHEDLSGECNKPWLKPGSLSMKKLVAAIRG
jgi:hypothetical protein